MLSITQCRLPYRVADPRQSRLGESQVESGLEVSVCQRLEWHALHPTSVKGEVMPAQLALRIGHYLQAASETFGYGLDFTQR